MNTDTSSEPHSYDALLLLSFGGPEGPDDVMEFLENVTRGRDVPRERLEVVAEQYLLFGGKSPINDLNRALIDALDAELHRRSVDLPIRFGNRNWAPYIDNTVQELAVGGARRVLALVTSAYSGYSSCRQYLEDIDRAIDRARPASDGIVIDKIRPFWNHPGFIAANVAHIQDALATLDPPDRRAARLVFTAHSIPLSMAASSDYALQLGDAAQLVTAALVEAGDRADDDFDLVFQSRSGPPQVPWLEPDIGDHLAELAAGGSSAVVVAPIGFIADHMEVVYDLDTQANTIATELGLTFRRAATAGTHPDFVSGLADLVEERLDPSRPVLALGELGPRPMPCAGNCCPAPVRRPVRET